PRCRNRAKPLPRWRKSSTKKAESGKREQNDVDAEKSEVPQADARAPQRQGVARRRFVVWRIRLEGARKRLDHRPPDRGFPRSHYALHQARRQIVDPHFAASLDEARNGYEIGRAHV